MKVQHYSTCKRSERVPSNVNVLQTLMQLWTVSVFPMCSIQLVKGGKWLPCSTNFNKFGIHYTQFWILIVNITFSLLYISVTFQWKWKQKWSWSLEYFDSLFKSLGITVLWACFKGLWTPSASFPDFFQNSWDFYTIRSVYLCVDCMLNLICSFSLVTKIFEFSCSSHF